MERTPTVVGREALRNHRKKFEPMDGATNPRGEHWVAENGDPVFVPYFGPPFTGDFFERKRDADFKLMHYRSLAGCFGGSHHMTASDMTKTEAPTRALLSSVGGLLFGPCWQSALARALGVSDRTMRYWLADRSIPSTVRAELLALMRDRIGTLAEAMREIQRSATPE